MNENLLNEKQAAEFLNLSPKTLSTWRSRRRDEDDKGPKFVRLSSRCIRYRQADLEEFINSKMMEATEQPA